MAMVGNIKVKKVKLSKDGVDPLVIFIFPVYYTEMALLNRSLKPKSYFEH